MTCDDRHVAVHVEHEPVPHLPSASVIDTYSSHPTPRYPGDHGQRTAHSRDTVYIHPSRQPVHRSSCNVDDLVPPLHHHRGVVGSGIVAGANQLAEVGLLDERAATPPATVRGRCRSPPAPRRRAPRPSPRSSARRWGFAHFAAARPPAAAARPPAPSARCRAACHADQFCQRGQPVGLGQQSSTRARRTAQPVSPAHHAACRALRRHGKTTPTTTPPGNGASRPGPGPGSTGNARSARCAR